MRNLLVIAIALYISLSIAVAQNDTNATPSDPCAGITCNPSKTSCPDGFVASCSNSCSNGVCSQCTPSCAGHETPKTTDPCAGVTCAPTTFTCPDGFVVSCSNTCSNGFCTTCAVSCAGHEAQRTNQTNELACPSPPEKPACPADAYSKPEYDSKGCITGYKCEPLQTTACPTPPLPSPDFCPDGKTEPRYDEKRCIVGYECVSAQPICAQAITPAMDAGGNCKDFPTSCLPPGWYKVGKCPERKGTCGNNICEEGEADIPGGCPSGSDPFCLGPPSYVGTCPQDCQKIYCGNSICEAGEEKYCRQDCISARETCPVTRTCGDGSQVTCRQTEHGCFCECPAEIPKGCREETDKEKGFVRVVCEKAACPVIPGIEDVKNKCEQGKGVFSLRKSPDGCEFPDCAFGDVSVRPVPVFNPLEEKKCPAETEDQREATRQGCEKLGLHFVITVRGDCKISKCSSKLQKQGCEPVPFEKRQRIENECRQRGLDVIKDFDESGCPLIKCGEHADCLRELPPEAYQKCSQQGGELVVRRDERGCITLSQCIVQADMRQADVDLVERIPEPAELLSMAFRLEELKIELDKLAKKTEEIADYYASTNSPDEGRYRRVSDMFEAAKDKVDEIKSKLREVVERGDIKQDDLIEVKRDIRYIKDVMMKDILYLMLSSSDDVKTISGSRAVKKGSSFEEVEATDETNCGSDGSCFDRGFRLCKKLVFYPEGRKGPKVEVRGLEGDACVMYAVLPEGEGPPAGSVPGLNPPYEMTCKIKKYALGVRTPEEDIFPYCEGSMVELMKKFGGPGGGPGVPGKCSGDECRDYCGRGPAEAKECLEHLGPYLPSEAKQGLEQLASGRQPRFQEFQRGEIREESSEFREFHEEFQPATTSQQACSGCLNNNICDPGECRDCADCLR